MILTFLKTLFANFVAHKTSSALSTVPLTGLFTPAAGDSGNIIIPSTVEEAVVQITCGIVGLLLIYHNPNKEMKE